MKRRNRAGRVLRTLVFACLVAAPLLTAAQGPADTRLDQARALLRQGRAADAEAEIRRFLAAGHDAEAAHVLLGLALYEEEKPADSLAEFTQAAKFGTPKASELVVVGLDYVKLRDLPGADRWMSMATRMNPADAAAWRYLGGIKYSENRFTEAMAAYGKTLALHPRDVLAEDGIGRSLEGLSRNSEAEAAYRTALEWQSAAAAPVPQPLLHLGALLSREGDEKMALPLLSEAEKLDPRDADVHEQLGEALAHSGDLNRAQGELEQALTLSPGNSHLHWLLASVYRRAGKRELAAHEEREYAALLGSHSSDKLH